MTPDEVDAYATRRQPLPTRESMSGYPVGRLALSVLFGLVLCLVFWAVILTAVVQFVLRLFGPDETGQLRGFAAGLGRYMGQIAGYMTFARDDRPFPFGPFPKD